MVEPKSNGEDNEYAKQDNCKHYLCYQLCLQDSNQNSKEVLDYVILGIGETAKNIQSEKTMLDLFYMFLSRYKTNWLEEIKKYFSALQKQ